MRLIEIKKKKRNWDATDCLIQTSPPSGDTVLLLSRERCARDQSAWEQAERGVGALQTAGLVFGMVVILRNIVKSFRYYHPSQH
jgi:hypothetical protein